MPTSYGVKLCTEHAKDAHKIRLAGELQQYGYRVVKKQADKPAVHPEVKYLKPSIYTAVRFYQYFQVLHNYHLEVEPISKILVSVDKVSVIKIEQIITATQRIKNRNKRVVLHSIHETQAETDADRFFVRGDLNAHLREADAAVLEYYDLPAVLQTLDKKCLPRVLLVRHYCGAGFAPLRECYAHNVCITGTASLDRNVLWILYSNREYKPSVSFELEMRSMSFEPTRKTAPQVRPFTLV